jgi:hypothetical protein
MIPQLKSIFNQNQLTSLINLLTQNVNALIAGKENVSNKQNSLAPDGTNTKYPTVTAVNTGLALKLNLTGGTMSGPIAMGTSKITGLGNPTANQDAATKFYVDNNVGAVPSLNSVLTSGNISQLNASIRTLGLFDPTYVNYGNVSLNNNVFIITNSFATQVIKMQDTVFSLGFHSNTKTVNLDSNVLSTNRTFTFPDIDGTFAIFDYSGSATGASSVTIDNKKGGVARFTNVIPAKDCRTLTLNSNFILSTSKIIPVLVYSGAGFPVILSQSVVAGQVDFIVANLDANGTGGASTDATISIEYQIVG